MDRTLLLGSISHLLLSRHLCKPEFIPKCVITHHTAPFAVLRFATIQTCSVLLSMEAKFRCLNHGDRGK